MSASVEISPNVVVRHNSGDADGEIVGWSFSLVDGRELWCGEISRARFAEMDDNEKAAMGSHDGWFLILHTHSDWTVLGKAVNEHRARELVDLIGNALLAGGTIEL